MSSFPGEQPERRTRVDQPHPLGKAILAPAKKSPSDVLQAVAGQLFGGGEQLRDQLQRHASQLGERLQNKQRSLSRREAEFNARSAQMEQELRTARLIIREREFDLQQRQQQFEEGFQRLQQQNADLVAATASVEAESAEQHSSVSSKSKAIIHSAEVWQQRLRRLDRDERTLQAQLADISHQQRQLEHREQTLASGQRDLANQRAQKRSADQEKLDRRMRELQELSEQLEQRRVSVQQLHADVSRMYREAIEIRIGTEQIWAQMKDVSPAELTETLGIWRRKLNDQYALAQQSLEDQKAEILALVEQLQVHEGRLSGQREEVRGWVTRRQDEIERQASQLLLRERELDQQKANLRHLELRWKEERTSLEQEVRKLKRMVGEVNF